MENKLHRLIFLTVVFFFAVGVQAQKRNARYVEYINKYSDLAVEQMKLHKIPASITLAQGLLESGAGYSQLARKSNNHFGIKCGGSWRGRTVRHDDDARNECFRAYKHPRDSYEDHSDFLRRGARYAKLVKYNDLQRDYTLMEGDIIYLKSKKKKASKPYTVYVVKDGDSMHGISQKYGIRLKNLYKMNRKDGEYVPEIGDRLRLR